MKISEIQALANGTTTDQATAARMTKCPPEILTQLTMVPTDTIVGKLTAGLALSNPNLPTAVLTRFVTDNILNTTAEPEDYTLQKMALNNPNLTADLVHAIADKFWSEDHGTLQPFQFAMIRGLITHPNCPRHIMNWAIKPLTRDQPPSDAFWPAHTKLILASNPNLPTEIAYWLLRDPASNIRTKTARNKHVPAALLEEIINDTNARVLTVLVKRLAGEPQKNVIAALQNKTGGKINSQVVIARHSTNQADISAAANNPDRRVRAAASHNKKTTDSDKIVIALQE